MGRRQDWQARIKQRVSRVAHGTGRRPVLQAAYGGLIAAQTAAASAWAGRRGGGPVDPGNLTLVVKTFERPGVLERMLASVRRVFSGPVVVADDSRTPLTLADPGVRVVALPFDTGIGAGRNALLAAVETEYVFMTDDDMVLLPDFDVARAVAYLDRNPGVDVVGGRVVHLPLWRTADYSSAALYAQRGEPRARQGTLIDGLPVAYKVPNFYIARTDAVRSIGYDDRLKRVDHNDFFTSAYGRLVCVVDPKMVCLHAHSYFDAHYQSFRMDTSADLAWIAQKWGGRDESLPEASGGLTPAQRHAFHHAAVEVVARDLGATVVHGGGPDSERARISVVGDAEPLLAVLGTMGWRGGRGHLTHPLWGELQVHHDEGAEGAVPATFAGIPGLAREAGRWPGVGLEGSSGWQDPKDHGGSATRKCLVGDVCRSPRAGWLETDEVVLAAPLPAGPVLTLSTPGDALFLAFGSDPRSPDEVVAEVLAAFDDPPADAEGQLHGFVRLLVEQGLLER